MGRTSKNIKLKIPEKPRNIKGFRSWSYQIATTISGQPRYDHFDTAAASDTKSSIIMPQIRSAGKSDSAFPFHIFRQMAAICSRTTIFA